ncbi:MAG: dihydroneopterin triphosphate diphosphatase [Sulfurifustis sp.]
MPSAESGSFKRPESVLVVVYTRDGNVLLLKRRDHANFWQSVTGSLDWDEDDPRLAAVRELREETGLVAEPAALRDLGRVERYRIFPEWRYRYAPGVTENVERAYALELPAPVALALHPEHSEYGWFDWRDALARTTSSTNRAAIEHLAQAAREPILAALPRDDAPAVVLVHGLWLAGWCMALIARRLRRRGFRTYLFSYSSVRRTLHENATALARFADAIDARTLHFVGHSLGGVVIQAMLNHCPPSRPGRIVTLGSPHAGTYVARALSRAAVGRFILGASNADVLRGERPPDLSSRDLGVIRGDLPIGLGQLFPGLGHPNDGVVAVTEATLPGAADEITLHVSHTAMLVSSRVAGCIGQFLRYGRFVSPS